MLTVSLHLYTVDDDPSLCLVSLVSCAEEKSHVSDDLFGRALYSGLGLFLDHHSRDDHLLLFCRHTRGCKYLRILGVVGERKVSLCQKIDQHVAETPWAAQKKHDLYRGLYLHQE